MFTGIVTTTAKITAITATQDNYNITLEYIADINIGESIAVDGICMDVVSQNGNYINFSLPKDIFSKTNFTVNKIVNIERAASASDTNRGHFITGKIDQLAEVKYSKMVEGKIELVIGNINKDYIQYLSPKSIIAINGVSLTIKSIGESTLSININPGIITKTNLRMLRPEDIIHVEYSIVAKNIYKGIIYNLQHINSIN